MFRLLSRQAVKAVPRPRLRLSTGTSRRIHSAQLPYTGPPSYETISRRFSSSQVDPQGFFISKRQQEAKDRGEFVDIHEGGIGPADYDVLITDISHQTLETTIAEELGIPYLSKATESDAKEVVEVGEGYIHGETVRPIVPFVVSRKDEARWVFFIVDTGSPLTYLSAQTSRVLGISERTYATIGGYRHAVNVSPSNSRFTDINILGGDYCKLNDVDLLLNYPNRRVKLLFGGGWKFTRESKL